MKETFSIAHISDLHFSHGAALQGTHAHSIKYLQDVQQVLQNHKFDKVIVSGDLTNRGDLESLLLVQNWLYGEFPISGNVKIGLHLPREIVGVVPGNHDAYDARRSSGGYEDCWQKSLKNFHEAFPETGEASRGCRYDWIEKGEHAIYIAYVDSCYLGDPTIEHHPDIVDAAISKISKIARGQITTEQSVLLVSRFDAGMRGELNHPTKTNEKISKEKFAKSFKIIVMHHYLFEPVGYPSDLFLSVDDRENVFKNFALADFDMSLCGHKHVPESRRLFYGDHMDKRARARYLIQLFRRTIGIKMMPWQFRNQNGNSEKKWFTWLLQVAYVQIKHSFGDSLPEGEYVSKLMDMLAECLRRPAEVLPELEEFIKTYQAKGYEEITPESLQQIQTRVCDELSKSQREMLGEFAETYLRKTIKTLNQRPYLQSMAGSASKRSGGAEKQRSFQTYSIEIDDSSVTINQERYTLDLGGSNPPTQKSERFIFKNYCMLNCKLVTA